MVLNGCIEMGGGRRNKCWEILIAFFLFHDSDTAKKGNEIRKFKSNGYFVRSALKKKKKKKALVNYSLNVINYFNCFKTEKKSRTIRPINGEKWSSNVHYHFDLNIGKL